MKATKEKSLTFSEEHDTGVYMKVDAAHGDCPETARSTTGVAIMMGGAAVDALSKRQTVVADSTMHAEIIALRTGVASLMYVLKVLAFLGICLPKPITVYEDNQSVIKFLTNPNNVSVSGRVKHFRLKLMWVKEQITDGLVKLIYVRSKDNTADVLTKLLARIEHTRHADVLLGLATDQKEDESVEFKIGELNQELEAYFAEMKDILADADIQLRDWRAAQHAWLAKVNLGQ